MKKNKLLKISTILILLQIGFVQNALAQSPGDFFNKPFVMKNYIEEESGFLERNYLITYQVEISENNVSKTQKSEKNIYQSQVKIVSNKPYILLAGADGLNTEKKESILNLNVSGNEGPKPDNKEQNLNKNQDSFTNIENSIYLSGRVITIYPKIEKNTKNIVTKVSIEGFIMEQNSDKGANLNNNSAVKTIADAESTLVPENNLEKTSDANKKKDNQENKDDTKDNKGKVEPKNKENLSNNSTKTYQKEAPKSTRIKVEGEISQESGAVSVLNIGNYHIKIKAKIEQAINLDKDKK